MGRRPKLTPELQKKIVDAIAAGNFNDVAAQYAGIVPSTFYRWITEGEAACSGIKKEFSDAVKEAAARAQIRMVAIINTAANQSWQAAAWWLERKYYQDWGRKQQVMGEGGGPIQHGVTFTELLIEASKEDGEDGGNG
tara:strand:- start:4565 stop:4978 length:414 start_codon:yes stop_codon:yes gene_type:complete